MNARFRQSLALLALLAAVSVGCSSSAVDASGGDGGVTSTPTKDGAKGRCCEPSTGGCANIGGYQEDGDCNKGALCDNMCEQQIVDDVHGCKKMVYKSPPVQTTYAGTGSCSSPVYNGQDPYGKDAGDAGDGDARILTDAGGD